MKEHFDELSNEEIVELIDGIFRNVASLFPPELSRENNWGYHTEDDFRWVKTDPPSEYPNWICDTRFSEANVDARIQEIIGRMDIGDLPGVWAVGPLSTPGNLVSHLEAVGFSKIAYFPGMVFDLQQLNEDEINSSPLRLPSDNTKFEVRRIESESDFSDWIRANMIGFQEHFHGTGCEESVYRNLLLSKKNEREVRFYGAYLDNEIVGAAQAVYYFSNAICKYVELHQCSVIPDCRQMGIARRLVTVPLLEAKQQDCVLASIFAAAKAADPYWTSMGFKPYCELAWYMRV